MIRRPLFILVALLTVHSVFTQKPFETLKTTITEASNLYGLLFSFDDAFIGAHLAYQKPLPETQEAFFKMLSTEYEINVSPSINKTYILEPAVSKGERFVCGSLYSQINSDAVEGALVVWGNQFTFTNAEGYFKFYPKQNIERTFSFRTQEGASKTEVVEPVLYCANYFIDLSEIQLGEVILNYTAAPIQKSLGGDFEIDLSALQVTAGLVDPDVFFLLQRLPGVNSPSTDANIYVRGGVPDQNLVLWNGNRLYHTTHAYGSLMAMNPYSIDQVRLITKGASSRYGDHTAGVLLLNNTPQWQDPTQFELGTNSIDSDLTLDLGIRKNDRLELSARKSFNSSFSNSFKETSFNRMLLANQSATPNNQQLHYEDFSGVFHKKWGEQWNLKASSFRSHDFSSYQLFGNEIELRDQVDSQNYGGGFQLNKTQKDQLFQMGAHVSFFNALFERSEIEYEVSDDEDDDEIEIDFKELNQRRNEVEDWRAYAQKQFNSTNTQSLIGAEIQFRKVEFENENQINDDVKNVKVNRSSQWIPSIFAEQRFDFETIYLEVGARSSYYQTIERIRLEPRAKGVLQLNRSSSLHAHFESKSQSVYKITETLANSLDRYNNLWISADKDQYPLLISYQTGAGYSLNKNKSTFEIDFYRKWYSGLTTYNYGYLDPNDQDFHEGTALIKGIDLFFQQEFYRGLFWLSYSFQDNNNTFQDLNADQAFPSNFEIAHTLNTALRIDFDLLTLEANNLWRSGIPYSLPSGYVESNGVTYLTYDILNQKNAPDFWRLDLSAGKDFLLGKKKRLSAKLALVNVLQRDNIVERIYRFNNQKNQIEYLDRYDLQPRIKVGLRFWF